MFEAGYKFRLATKQVVRNEFPLIEKIVYAFITRKNRTYIVDVHRYEYRVYVLKFHCKAHSNSKDRYNLILNDFDVSMILKTVLNIAIEILNKDSRASFAFVGVRKFDEAEVQQKRNGFESTRGLQNTFLEKDIHSHLRRALKLLFACE